LPGFTRNSKGGVPAASMASVPFKEYQRR
jgi:hypothetical protein